MHIALMFAVWMGILPHNFTPAVYEHIHQASIRYNVPLRLSESVMVQESQGHVYAIHFNSNGTVDMGLYQINSTTWIWLSDQYNHGVIQWPYDPTVNATMAIHYLHDLHTVTGSWRKALEAYNAGINGDVPQSTVLYTNDIIQRADM